MAIIVSGTPGTGKTRTARKLAKEKGYKYVNVNKIIAQNKEVISGYDKKRKSKIIDEKKLVKILVKLINDDKKVVIDSHLSHFIPKEYVEKCVITKTDLKKLKNRLKRRGYSKAKVEENLEVEIMDICLEEAKEKKHKIKIIKT
ncbi:AAA family ATPase [Nanoarchaeota archaeon]